jgi:hypothetical protein
MSKLFACLIATLVVVATLGTPARAADPYNINVILSMTGQGAFLGKSAAIAIDAA